jgi:hypothetical protein
MNYSVESIPLFDKQAKRLSKKYPSLKKELNVLSRKISLNPQEGIPLGNNFYKIRLAISSKGKGKSGGARVITYVKIVSSVIYLVTIFDKSEKSNITSGELEAIFNMVSFKK